MENKTDILDPIIDHARKLIVNYRNNQSLPKPIIAIAGGPGVGKTHFSRLLQRTLQQDGYCIERIKQDNFLLYDETGFEVLDAINPRLKWKQLHEVLRQMRLGKSPIVIPLRDKTKRPFTTYYTAIDAHNVDLVLFEGKHALSGPTTFNFFAHCSFGIFMQATDEHMVQWKIEREQARPVPLQKSTGEFEKSLVRGMDIYRRYILPTKKNASFVLYKDAKDKYTRVEEQIHLTKV